MDLAITPATGPRAAREGAGPGMLAESPIYLMAVNKSGIKPTGSGSETMREAWGESPSISAIFATFCLKVPPL